MIHRKQKTIVLDGEYYNNEEDDEQFETARNFQDSNPCNRIEIATTKKEKILFTLQCMKNYFTNYNCNLEDIVTGKYTKQSVLSDIMILLRLTNVWSIKEDKMLQKLIEIYNLTKEDEQYRITNKLKCNGDKNLKF